MKEVKEAVGVGVRISKRVVQISGALALISLSLSLHAITVVLDKKRVRKGKVDKRRAR